LSIKEMFHSFKDQSQDAYNNLSSHTTGLIADSTFADKKISSNMSHT